MDEVREVGYLGLGQRGRFAAALHGMALGEEGNKRAAVSIVQNHVGLNEVLAFVGAARAGSVAFDALRDPH